MLLKADGEVLHDLRERLGDERIDAALLLIIRIEDLIGSAEVDQGAFDRIADESFDDTYRGQYLTDKIVIAQVVEKIWMFGDAFRVWRRKSKHFQPNSRDGYPYIPLKVLLYEQS